MAEQRQTVWVVVLGDFGRSPRMQYHALSLADQASAVACRHDHMTHRCLLPFSERKIVIVRLTILPACEQAGVEVEVLAQGGTSPFPAVAQHDHIHTHTIPDT